MTGNWGGRRPGTGRKAGEKLKPDRLKRVRQQISVPRELIEKLKAEETNLSRYILRLILRDKGWEPPE